MRSIVRQSARLATQTRSRQSSLPRCRPAQQIRKAHSGTPPDSRDSSDQTDRQSKFEKQQDEHKKRDDDSARTEHNTDLNGSKSTEDGRKPGLRKTLRRQRNGQDKEGIPAPPPIPAWFLKHNVRLQSDVVSPDRQAKHAEVLRCVDQETGHTLFEVPYYEGWPQALQESEKNLDTSGAVKSTAEATEKSTGDLDRDFFNNKFPGPLPNLQDIEGQEQPISSSSGLQKYNTFTVQSIFRWILLEIDSSIRAAFTAASNASQSSSYAASRVDISLQCPDSDSHDQMDFLVESIASITEADVIRFDANDFADLTAEYVGQGLDSPGSFSTLAHDVFDGYSTTAVADRHSQYGEEGEEDDMAEDEDIDEEPKNVSGNGGSGFGTLADLRKALYERRHDLSKALSSISVTIGLPQSMKMGGQQAMPSSPFRPMPTSSNQPWDETRLTMLLDSLLDAAKVKQTNEQQLPDATSRLRAQQATLGGAAQAGQPEEQQRWNLWSNIASWLPDVAGCLTAQLRRGSSGDEALAGKLILRGTGSASPAVDPRGTTTNPISRTIVHVRDLKDLCSSRIGDAIVQRLVRVVQKRRRAGEHIVVVGTTAQDAYGTLAMATQDEGSLPFKTLTIPPLFDVSAGELDTKDCMSLVEGQAKNEQYRRIQEINLRNIQSMLHRLRPADDIDLFSENAQSQLRQAGCQALAQTVFTLGQVHRVVLTAIGLSQRHAVAETMHPIHIGLAALVVEKADQAAQVGIEVAQNLKKQQQSKADARTQNSEADEGRARLDGIRKTCDPHEKRLFSGVVDSRNIKTGFNEVHAAPETIDALRTLTSLSLLRPDAFAYGVLAQDRLPGLMLYGPPGTGKTLLAKAVAKESRATVLEVSGAQIYEKYVGEGEKMVRAVFSLARKLTPCIVFIDEADAIFGSRGHVGARTSHREIINQFLREWDGMDAAAHHVFVMVATNRPFDLDDAVLRRLPRRLLVDLPVARDRESILGIHLRGEILDASVSLPLLAEQTALYSGSDLKNLCVAAALACVREENARAQYTGGGNVAPGDRFPDKRVLSARHFESAIKEISASISEDMSSLTAIRKFDEQYGDRRGRRKKAGYGFGMGDGNIDESGARVRQSVQTPPP